MSRGILTLLILKVNREVVVLEEEVTVDVEDIFPDLSLDILYHLMEEVLILLVMALNMLPKNPVVMHLLFL